MLIYFSIFLNISCLRFRSVIPSGRFSALLLLTTSISEFLKQISCVESFWNRPTACGIEHSLRTLAALFGSQQWYKTIFQYSCHSQSALNFRIPKYIAKLLKGCNFCFQEVENFVEDSEKGTKNNKFKNKSLCTSNGQSK